MFVTYFIDIIVRLTSNKQCNEFIIENVPRFFFPLNDPKNLFGAIPETKNANMAHRAIGLGLMGFQDALNILGLSYASHEAVEFADKSMEMISYYAILYSSELAKERNPYPSYKGSKWERGLLPIDTIALLEKERGEKKKKIR